ncbi:MAG: thioredoxin family protein [Bacteroidales bacterium]|jgi:thiol-disulfide isomerase/thioredoxin|nr:thioredoxin family protein [Bacteroidales bacterium]
MNKIIYDEKKEQDIIYGECNKAGFLIPEFSEWFLKEYNSYQVKDSLFVESYDTKFDSIYVFLGTWCEDSQREVPRFIKIMENPYFEDISIRFFCIDGDKKTDIIDAESFYLQLVPTFIFYHNGEELCRIVETPRIGLEEDIMDLVWRMQK